MVHGIAVVDLEGPRRWQGRPRLGRRSPSQLAAVGGCGLVGRGCGSPDGSRSRFRAGGAERHHRTAIGGWRCAEIGEHAILSRGVLVGHHAQIGDFATLNPGANVGGNSEIGAVLSSAWVA